MIRRVILTAGVVGMLGIGLAVAQQGQAGGPPCDRRPGPMMGGPGGPHHHPPGPPPPPPLLIALDADKDGELSAEEIANAANALATLDHDGDGTLDRRELMPPPPPRPGPREDGERPSPVEHIMRHDQDGDGLLTVAELLPPPAKRLFEEADANSDGALDQTELETFFENQPQPEPPAYDQHPPQRGQRQERQQRGPRR